LTSARRICLSFRDMTKCSRSGRARYNSAVALVTTSASPRL
jgi:hypothetical protein